MDNTVSESLVGRGGGLTARLAKRKLIQEAWSRGLTIDFEQSGGFFDKVMKITVRGPEPAVRDFIDTFKETIFI